VSTKQQLDKKTQLKNLKTQLKDATAKRKELQKGVNLATKEETKIRNSITKLSGKK
jgi:hypothetical protein